MSSPVPSSLPRWRKGQVRVLATTRVLELHGVQFVHPVRKTEREFSVIHAHDWVNVIAVTPDRELVLVKQFRYGIDGFSLEVPGGVIEPGEDPVQAGVRELEEETGYVGTGARLLGQVHPNPAIQDNRCHLVLVEQVTRKSAQAWDPDEEIEVLTLPVDEAYALAHAGEITHALALNALFLFSPHWAGMKARS
ncbi:MAG: NUDIX hydrolase [Opitutaceae bacterium]